MPTGANYLDPHISGTKSIYIEAMAPSVIGRIMGYSNNRSILRVRS